MTTRKYKRMDLAGQKYGILTVIKEEPKPAHLKSKWNRYWLCCCECGNERIIMQENLRGGQNSCGCVKHVFKASLEDNFWRKVSKTENGCWLWTTKTDKDGYGIFHGLQNKQIRAHRFSWVMHNREIPEAILVLHKCDTPGCIRPSHLFLGTPKDNTQDMLAKGRGRWA